MLRGHFGATKELVVRARDINCTIARLKARHGRISYGNSALLQRGECQCVRWEDSFFGKLPEILAATKAVPRAGGLISPAPSHAAATAR
jgi:hypothetical protein